MRIGTAHDLACQLDEIGRPAVLKTATLGYDGKGQVMIDAETDAAEAYRAMGAEVGILEGFVDFACEVSVVLARGLDGKTAAFDVVENRHSHHILDVTLAPAAVDAGDRARGRTHRRAHRRGARPGRAAGGRDVRDQGRPRARQRDRAAPAQLGPLDHRCLRHQPVRAVRARRMRPAAGRSVAPFRRHHEEPDRRRGGPLRRR